MENKQLEKYNIKLYPKNEDIIFGLRNTNYSSLQMDIMANRLTQESDYEILHKYTTDKLDIMKDLYKLKDIDKAGKLIAHHIKSGSHICLITDYDADGIDSAAVLTNAMTDIFGMDTGVNLTTIVNRRRDGNGFNKYLIDRTIQVHSKNKIDLIISADHGSSDEHAMRIFKNLGIETVLTDHHEIPPDNYPKSATVFINNQRTDSEYTINASGCFIAFLTMVATYDALHGNVDMSKFNQLLPFVALTTISDVMSLRDPINRQLVHVGFNELNSLRNPVWLALITLFKINTKINSTEIGFKLAPLINTGNRVGAEDIVFNMLTSKTFDDAMRYAKELNKLSALRKRVQKEKYKIADAQAIKNKFKNSLVVSIESELAISGIIAGQIGESYNLPTVCFISSPEQTTMSGSARGILPTMDIVSVFRSINNEDDSIFIKFGGHKLAGGCSIYTEKLDKFRELFDKYTAEIVDINKIDKIIYIDKFIDTDMLTPGLINDIERLGPYGKDWPYPKFTSVVKIKYMKIFGNMGRFAFKTRNDREIECMYFFNKDSTYSKDEIETAIDSDKPVIITYEPQMNNFNGITNLQLSLKDIRNIDE